MYNFAKLLHFVGLGLMVAATWNTAILHESTTVNHLALAITIAEWALSLVCLSVVYLLPDPVSSCQKASASPDDVLTVEQIETAIKARITADENAARCAVLKKFGKE